MCIRDRGEGMAWRGKGLALGRLERPQEAIDCFDKALEIDPYDDIAQRSKDIELEEIKAMDTMTQKSIESFSKTAEKIEVIEKSEPLDVLKMRLARGEITLEEFKEIKEHLE